MLVTDFDYHLPQQLIARYPLPERNKSRLLYLDKNTGHIIHQHFTDFIDFIDSRDLLVFNDTKVIPARLLGHKVTGGKVEILVERVLDEHLILALVRSSKALQPGMSIIISNNVVFQVVSKKDEVFELACKAEDSIWAVLERYGHVPLPPYVKRQDEAVDKARYQTIYAKMPGACAAPTAGLHFDQGMLHQLQAKGVDCAYVTLHVGAGTFMPVRVQQIVEHKMHKEWYHVSANVCAKVQAAKVRGGRVIAVGTTAVRALESAASNGELAPAMQETQLFIYPGFQFNVADALLTNFHLPLVADNAQSTVAASDNQNQ